MTKLSFPSGDVRTISSACPGSRIDAFGWPAVTARRIVGEIEGRCRELLEQDLFADAAGAIGFRDGHGASRAAVQRLESSACSAADGQARRLAQWIARFRAVQYALPCMEQSRFSTSQSIVARLRTAPFTHAFREIVYSTTNLLVGFACQCLNTFCRARRHRC